MGRFVAKNQAWSFQTGSNGSVSISIPVPGIFTQMTDDNSGNNGRYFKEIDLWCDTPSIGDIVTNLSIQDTNEILSLQSAQFPLYPIILPIFDYGNVNQGLWVPPIGLSITPAQDVSDRGYYFIPSQLFLCGTFQSGNNLIGMTIRINVIWSAFITTLQ